MDLDATLIRAEHLFRRFRRLVDAIDNKQTLPAPRPQSPGQASSQSAPSPATTAGSRTKNTGKAPEEPKEEKVITPELRRLLSRKVDIVPRKKPVVKAASAVSEGT